MGKNRITVPIKLAKMCSEKSLLFIKFAKVQSIYIKTKASCLLAAEQLQRTPYNTEWWLIRGTFRWSIVNGGFHMHVTKIIYLIAIWVYKYYTCFVIFGRKDGFTTNRFIGQIPVHINICTAETKQKGCYITAHWTTICINKRFGVHMKEKQTFIPICSTCIKLWLITDNDTHVHKPI